MISSARQVLLVRVRVANPASVDTEKLDRIVRAAKPAHVPHKVEILPLDGPGKGRSKAPEPDKPKGGASPGGGAAKSAATKSTAAKSAASAAPAKPEATAKAPAPAPKPAASDKPAGDD
jgi:hypothetical protein